MVEASAGPLVIVVAERPVSSLLSDSGIGWIVQDRQPSIAAMWDSLSGGRLDQHSRILVFSDSLAEGTDSSESELVQTARAIVAMSHAGAQVFVAIWRPDDLASLRQRISDAAAGQGLDVERLTYHVLPASDGAHAVLESLREVLAGDVVFPEDFGPAADEPLVHPSFVPSEIWAQAPVLLPTAAPEPVAELPEAAAEAEPPVAELPEAAAEEDVVAEAPDETPAEADLFPDSAAETAEGEALQQDGSADGLVADVTADLLIPPGTPQPPDTRTPPITVIDAADSAAGDGTAISEGAPSGGSFPTSAPADLLARPRLPGQTTIVVTSSKGGSGKSTASILLGGSIARASARSGTPLSVCLVDLDTRDGQIASLIGKFMPTALNIRVQQMWDEDTIRRNLVHADGLGVEALLAPIRPRTADTVGPDFYRTVIRSLQRMYDVLILDTSVQYLDPLIAEVALPEADEILFVTTLASTAVQGMARALREITTPLDELGLGIPREKIGIIVNQSVANVGMEREQVLAAGLGVPVVGVIPLATKDVLTATNLNRMDALLRHPLIGPAYNSLARACLPDRGLAEWEADRPDAQAAMAGAGPVGTEGG